MVVRFAGGARSWSGGWRHARSFALLWEGLTWRALPKVPRVGRSSQPATASVPTAGSPRPPPPPPRCLETLALAATRRWQLLVVLPPPGDPEEGQRRLPPPPAATTRGRSHPAACTPPARGAARRGGRGRRHQTGCSGAATAHCRRRRPGEIPKSAAARLVGPDEGQPRDPRAGELGQVPNEVFPAHPHTRTPTRPAQHVRHRQGCGSDDPRATSFFFSRARRRSPARTSSSRAFPGTCAPRSCPGRRSTAPPQRGGCAPGRSGPGAPSPADMARGTGRRGERRLAEHGLASRGGRRGGRR